MPSGNNGLPPWNHPDATVAQLQLMYDSYYRVNCEMSFDEYKTKWYAEQGKEIKMEDSNDTEKVIDIGYVIDVYEARIEKMNESSQDAANNNWKRFVERDKAITGIALSALKSNEAAIAECHKEIKRLQEHMKSEEKRAIYVATLEGGYVSDDAKHMGKIEAYTRILKILEAQQ